MSIINLVATLYETKLLQLKISIWEVRHLQESKLHMLNLCKTTQKHVKTCINCTGAVWLASPAAIAFSMLCTTVASISLITTWVIHKMYKKCKLNNRER